MPLISEDLLKQLLDASYRLAVTVHGQEVHTAGPETAVIEALHRVEEETGLEPTDYACFGDPQVLPSYKPDVKMYYMLTDSEVNDLLGKHLGMHGYNCAREEAWSSEHIEFVTANPSLYWEKDRQMLAQLLSDFPDSSIPLTLTFSELAVRHVLPVGEYMVWVM